MVGREVVAGGRGLDDDELAQGRHHAVVAGREQGEGQLQDADVGAEAGHQHGVQPVGVDPVDDAVAPGAVGAVVDGLDRRDEAVGAVLGQDRDVGVVGEPGEGGGQRAARALGGVDEGEDGEAALDAAARQASRVRQGVVGARGRWATGRPGAARGEPAALAISRPGSRPASA